MADTNDKESSMENAVKDVINSTALYDNLTTSNETLPNLGRDEDLAKFEIAVSGIIFALAILGNGLVLIILLTRRKKLSRMNMMIVHLSAADLFVAFFNVLPQLIWDITHRFYGGDFLCRFVKYVQVVAMYASSYVLVSTAIDRYMAIVHPLTAHTWTSRRMHMLVGVAWLFSAMFSTPQIAIFSYKEVKEGSGVYDCWATFQPEWTLKLYITFFTVAVYIIPFFLLLGAYGQICYVVFKSMVGREVARRPQQKDKKNSNKIGGCENGSLITESDSGSGSKGLTVCNSRGGMTSSNPRAHVKGVSRAKVKTVKLTITVIVCYLVCWGPFFIAQMWSAWDPKAPFENVSYVIIMLLASLNSCTNPWIYMIYTEGICSKLRGFVTDSRMSGKRRKLSTSMVIILLLASLNSCTNPWIYLAFSTNTCKEFYQRHCRTEEPRMRSQSATFDSIADSKYKTAKTTDYTHISGPHHEMPLLKSDGAPLRH